MYCMNSSNTVYCPYGSQTGTQRTPYREEQQCSPNVDRDFEMVLPDQKVDFHQFPVHRYRYINLSMPEKGFYWNGPVHSEKEKPAELRGFLYPDLLNIERRI